MVLKTSRAEIDDSIKPSLAINSRAEMSINVMASCVGIGTM